MKQIDILPDDVLLDIFDFYIIMNPSCDNIREMEPWQSPVHVCRRWRSLVFESPRRLNLRIGCRRETPTRDILDVWPALPIIVTVAGSPNGSSETDNIIAALEQSDRVCQVFLFGHWDRELQKVLAAMQVPFPELTYMQLSISADQTRPVLPNSFLGGSAPRLQDFSLQGIVFPGLPTLLLSATHLVDIRLDIPDSGYISPEAMVAPLSALSSLRKLYLVSCESRPDWETRSPPPPERSILPALKKFQFKGVTNYLEDFVTIVDAPQLEKMDITFINRIDFDCPRLAQFINRTPKLGKRDEAHVGFGIEYLTGRVRFGTDDCLQISISCPALWNEPDRLLSSVAQVCNSSLPATVGDLYIVYRGPSWSNGTDNTPWLQLLLPFAAVKNLYLSKKSASGIAAALQELAGARITEVLPSLQNIFVRGLEPSRRFQANIRHFVAARQHSNRPIAISVWGQRR
jgi:hypothetical protein